MGKRLFACPPLTGNTLELRRHSGMDRRTNRQDSRFAQLCCPKGEGQGLSLMHPDCMDASNPCHPWSLGSGAPCRNDEENLCQQHCPLPGVEVPFRLGQAIKPSIHHRPPNGSRCLYFGGSHFRRMAFMLEQNKPLDPVHICLFGADAQVLQANLVAHLIQHSALH